MSHKRLIPILSKFLIIFTIAALLAGCQNSSGNARSGSTGNGKSVLTKDTVFRFYHLAQLNKSKSDINKKIRVARVGSRQVKNAYTYTDPATGFGVYITYNDKNVSTSKTLIYPEAKDLAFLFTKQVTKKQADGLTRDMDYAAVKGALGEEGIERNVTETRYGGDTHMYYWVNNDGSLIQAIFGTDGKLISEMYTN